LDDCLISADWDDDIVLAYFDDRHSICKLGQRDYLQSEVLNHRIGTNVPLRRNQRIEGYILAGGLRPIPAEYRDFCTVALRISFLDQFDHRHPAYGRLSVARMPQRQKVVVREGSLYEGGPAELSPAEEASRYRERLKTEPKPVFREPLTPAQRLEENMRYAALVREEAWREKAERRREKAWQRRHSQEETVIPTQLEASPRQPQETETGPAGSPACGDDGVESFRELLAKNTPVLGLDPETVAWFENMLRGGRK